ncbi:hypothetical protein E8E14_007660 [Neopestalotiopsis sp. 37M]|nr:hypothetical protein E8E14_007660 [Neopestalotiopsis sp. 37M]
MKAAYILALSIGGVSCFPKLAPIIQSHVERRFLDTTHLQLRDEGDEATTSNDATTDETTASSSTESVATSTTTASASDASATDSSETDTSITVTIMDTTGTLQLNPGVDGNLFISLPEDAASITNLVPGSSDFIAYTDSLTIMGDNSETSRLLYYYPDEMSKLSVSRIRLGAWGSIPKGAQLASFVPFNDGNGNEVLVVLDTSGNYFWPVVCALDGQLNKVFIAQDPEEGPETLMSNGDLRYILTGGDVTDCGPLALTASGLSGSYS